MSREVRVAVFRPDDERLASAVDLLESLGAEPVADPMLAVEPTGDAPASGSDYAVFTSKTGVELAAESGWSPDDATTLAAIGPATAAVAREAGWTVDVVPDDYSSAGLVAALRGEVDGASVEVARSDHGTAVLLDALGDADADVHETVLYELVTPPGAGESVDRAVAGELEAAAFTSSLTVENFLALAAERGDREAAVAGLNDAVVGVIGEPTRETAASHGVDVDVVPAEATFDALATAVVEAAAPTYHG